MRKKIDYNQFMLARRVAELIGSLDTMNYSFPKIEILPDEDCTQVNVFMYPSDLCSDQFYASLVMSDEVNKDEYVESNEARSKRFSYLRKEFDENSDELWGKAINKYGKKFYLKFDNNLKKNINYMFSVYGEVPDEFDQITDGLNPYKNGFMKN